MKNCLPRVPDGQERQQFPVTEFSFLIATTFSGNGAA